MRLIIGFGCYLLASVSYADFITFSAEVNSGGSPKIVIDNRSDVGWQMIRATFDFAGTPASLQEPQPLAFGVYGSYQTANTSGGRNSLSAVEKTASLIRFNFTGLNPGDGFGVSINIGDVRGSEMSGATIEALYRHVETEEVQSLKYTYDNSGSGRSFPAFASASVPEPGAVLLLALLGGVGFSRLRLYRQTAANTPSVG